MSPSRWKLCVIMAAVLGSACDDRVDKDGMRTEAKTAAALPSAHAGERTETKQAARKNGFVQNIEALTESNRDFRRVIYTGRNLQLVLMRIPAGDHIGAETHDVDQFFRIESGTGRIVIDGKQTDIGPGSAMLVPAGATHDVMAGERGPLELYTLYAPPNHRDGVVHHTRADAEHDDERFDGRTTE